MDARLDWGPGWVDAGWAGHPGWAQDLANQIGLTVVGGWGGGRRWIQGEQPEWATGSSSSPTPSEVDLEF